MSSSRNLLYRFTPEFLVRMYRKRQRKQRHAALDAARVSGNFIRKADLERQLLAMGIGEGDTLLMHSSMSKMGYLQGGPATVVASLLEALGANGHLLMPSSPLPLDVTAQKYFEIDHIFDVLSTPSRMGAITEFFRKVEGVKRSLHPTEPVCVFGPEAHFFIKDHFGQPTPYNTKSPFYRVAEIGGKVLLVGVSLNDAHSMLHLLEDTVDFKLDVYAPEWLETQVMDEQKIIHTVKTKVHSLVHTKKRDCDKLLDLFEAEGVLQYGQLGKAKCIILEASKLLEVMVAQYHSKGVTMYTPQGSKSNKMARLEPDKG